MKRTARRQLGLRKETVRVLRDQLDAVVGGTSVDCPDHGGGGGGCADNTQSCESQNTKLAAGCGSGTGR